MGRRALRKIDPAVDLAPFLRTLDQVAAPFDASALLGRCAPLEIEVGSGKGLFLAQAAAALPDRYFVGIEVSQKYARYAAARLAKAELANALMIHGDALRLMAEFISDDSVAAVHVYFPDPWWKKRHRRRRVMNEAFLQDVERVLEPGGALHFWTDVEEYYQTTIELIARCTALSGPIVPPPRPAGHDLDYRTHFERRMRLRGEPVFRAEFRQAANQPG